ncbi:MAG: ribonuclease III [Acidobacteriota bacterium]
MPPPDLPGAEPVVVLRTHSDIEASIVRGLLDAHGITATLTSDVPHSVFPLSVDGLGEVRITVSAAQADEAARLIADYRQDERRGTPIPLRDEFADLESSLGHRFRDRGMLEHALTHRSRAHEDVTGGVVDNESLEFLGDAVLGFIVADMLFRRYPDRDEGQKSKMKASLVSAATLADRAERLNLGQHLLLGRGEEKSGGRRKLALLADSYEAVIAALYLDGGIGAAQTFLERELGDLVEEAGRPGAAADFKSALQEHLQAKGDPLPAYVVAAQSGPAHRRTFHVEVRLRGVVLASADGRTKKEAEQEAARLALEGERRIVE